MKQFILALVLVTTSAVAAPLVKVCAIGANACSKTDYSYLLNGPEARIMPVPAMFSCPSDVKAKVCELR